MLGTLKCTTAHGYLWFVTKDMDAVFKNLIGCLVILKQTEVIV